MFQVGDKVRCIDDSSSSYLDKGSSYIVTYVYTVKYVDVMDKFGSNHYTLDQSGFELVKEETMFKIGDKVKCVDNSYSTLNNDDIYTVIRVCGNFDVITNNYNCKGYIDIGSGYIMKPSRFKLVKETTMFKVGDKVRCIDVKDINLNLGQTYIITEVACGIYVKVDGVVCMASRFEPVKEIEPIHIDCKRYWTWFC